MSLDFTIMEEVYSRNITHNLSKMWLEAGVYDALYNSSGKCPADVLPILEHGLEIMTRFPERFTPLNPKNGWGDFEGAKNFLREVISACKESEFGEIRISK